MEEPKKSILSSDEEETIKMIMRQTTYDRQTVIEKLAQHNNDVFKLLRDFMRIPDKKDERKISLNQSIYKEIRTTLGSVPIANLENKNN